MTINTNPEDLELRPPPPTRRRVAQHGGLRGQGGLQFADVPSGGDTGHCASCHLPLYFRVRKSGLCARCQKAARLPLADAEVRHCGDPALLCGVGNGNAEGYGDGCGCWCNACINVEALT